MVTGEEDDGEPQEEDEEEKLELMKSSTDFMGNMKRFINHFGISLSIPSYYPQGAAIFP